MLSKRLARTFAQACASNLFTLAHNLRATEAALLAQWQFNQTPCCRFMLCFSRTTQRSTSSNHPNHCYHSSTSPCKGVLAQARSPAHSLLVLLQAGEQHQWQLALRHKVLKRIRPLEHRQHKHGASGKRGKGTGKTAGVRQRSACGVKRHACSSPASSSAGSVAGQRAQSSKAAGNRRAAVLN